MQRTRARAGRKLLSFSLLGAVAAAGVLAATVAAPAKSAGAPSLAALGDSLVIGYGATGNAAADPAESFATGSDPSVSSLAARLGGSSTNAGQDGVTMAGLESQASSLSGSWDDVVVEAGTNDVCTNTAGQMTDPSTFSNEFESVLHTLTTNMPSARILVVSIPDWVAMYNALSSDPAAIAAWATTDHCPTVLGPSADRSAAASEITALNGQLQQVCATFGQCTYDGGAAYANFQWSAAMVSTDDYFHLSVQGQAQLASLEWGVGAFSSGSGGTTSTGTTTTSTSTVGNGNVGGNSEAPPAQNYLDVTGPYAAGTSGTISKAFGYLAGGGTAAPLRVAVYADSGGSPGALVGVSGEVSLPASSAAGWVQFSFPSPLPLTAGTSYWLGYWIGGNGITYYYDAGTDAFTQDPYSSTGTPDDPFGTASTGASEWSLYAALDESSGGTGGGGTVLLGNTHVGSQQASPQAQDYVDVTGGYTLSTAGSVGTMSGYLAGSPTGDVPLRTVIYADSGGQPGGVVGVSTPTTIPQGASAQWFTFTLSPAVQLAAGTYWIGYWIGGNGVSYYFDAGASGSEYFGQDAYSATGSPPPPPAGWQTTNSPSQFSLYATVTTASTSGGGSGGSGGSGGGGASSPPSSSPPPAATTTTTVAAATTTTTSAPPPPPPPPTTTSNTATPVSVSGGQQTSKLALTGLEQRVRVTRRHRHGVPTLRWLFRVTGAQWLSVSVVPATAGAKPLDLLRPSWLGDVHSGRLHKQLWLRTTPDETVRVLLHLRRNAIRPHRRYLLVAVAHRLDGTTTTLRKPFVGR